MTTEGEADPVKKVNEMIRSARREWDAHNNAACRRLRARALRAYEALTPEQRRDVPAVLRVWLRYRSERYFGARPGKRPRRGRNQGGA